mgnify:CR=1 FL=1
MKKPVLVIMAAGMGSRYGGLKQIDPVDEDGHIIIDFSIYDAKEQDLKKLSSLSEESTKKTLERVSGTESASSWK